MIITGLKAGDHIIDAKPEEAKTYKGNHIDNIIVNGRLETRLWLEGVGYKETRTISSDEFIVMKMTAEDDYKIMTVAFKLHAVIEGDRDRTALLIANRRELVDEVNTISLTAFDARHPHLAPVKEADKK